MNVQVAFYAFLVNVLYIGRVEGQQQDLFIANPSQPDAVYIPEAETESVIGSPDDVDDILAQQVVLEDQIAPCAFIVSQYEEACAEVYRPVCAVEENTIYWNCCYFHYYGNSTSYVEGECEGDAAVFRSYDDIPLSDVTVETLPILDGAMGPGSRKILQDDYENYLIFDEPAPTPVMNTPPAPEPETPVEINMEIVDGEDHIIFDSEQAISALVFESVIDTNDLRMIRRTTLNPFRTIGRFEHLGCTGFLIDDNLVLTSAYCVFDRRIGRYYNQDDSLAASAFDFTPAQNGPDVAPFGKLKWSYAYVPWQYNITVTSQEDQELADQHDFALVVLKDSFIEACQAQGSPNCGFMEFGSECLNRNVNLNVAGYRLERQLAANESLAERLWVAPCENQDAPCDSKRFDHTCDTTAGMAGAPLWVSQKLPDGNVIHTVRGIHSIGLTDVNKAVTMNEENVERIQGWILDAKSRSGSK
eukprot:TRINITY_DN3046_c0_g1_i1.p1 TRINITY_DN3046_c0_g1~~TRINITY_DN3046_c0_g1_i1.p1  ORF type:complete len:473 (-),score=56.69 TRINITY_DN3046_c0_g1_i1:450-1868(-)